MGHVLFSTSQKVGLADFGDDADVSEAMEMLDQMISMLYEDRENNDKYVHPPAEARIPGITAKFVDDPQRRLKAI